MVNLDGGRCRMVISSVSGGYGKESKKGRIEEVELRKTHRNIELLAKPYRCRTHAVATTYPCHTQMYLPYLDVEIDEEVDVIISEWMGYMLLYELYMVPITHPDRYTESIDFWRNVYGIDMSAMLPLAKQCAFEEPSVETISGENVLTWPHVMALVFSDPLNLSFRFDRHVMMHVPYEWHALWGYCIGVSGSFEIVQLCLKLFSLAPFHGFAFWFDVEFSSPAIFPTDNNAPSSVIESPTDHPIDGSQRKKRANPNEALVLSTAPEDPPTHWQQTLIYFYDPIEVEQDQVISGSVTLSQSKENPRFMNIHLEYASGGRAYVKESVMR
ncbi:hypothetical protein TEA_028725 [Camellia sinensis var. sinensis]|uniref:Protein arginine N-methyltransferase domain-containing protein n=1 Tax=Camellia sinensis var. sinensis TaxID=542762 RepID=A0A4S4EBQ2_CAMSN|nr:hypothetical protein TEA_028725 [Camellia sinensis var. sinensis]